MSKFTSLDLLSLALPFYFPLPPSPSLPLSPSLGLPLSLCLPLCPSDSFSLPPSQTENSRWAARQAWAGRR
ncbi:hypothetical protein PDE_03320 [Penicillium oxalicum 114-2]|uniref:Uncharacterized protein n=1 Tax=Penicillium oxalicum (strain 114-2 / CGMCC 5302) TaxID=933388 RepID=S7ZDP3_PENO1|nr:hypothetical protein PDE_03320 [Penicillium oxalicum 114-2]